MPKSSGDRRHFIIAGVLVVISTIFMNWLLNAAMPLPIKASIEALTIDGLIWWHLLLIAFLFSLVVVFMLYAIVVFRQRPNDDSDGEHFEGNYILEIAWTAIPLVLVIIFGYIGYQDLTTISEEKPNELVIKATGQQWSWVFEYEGGVISPELVLPVNRHIKMEMESKDVLHSFWVPEFRVKQDLVPGHPTHVRFMPTITSKEYTAQKGRDIRLVCAELCGLTHYDMKAKVEVLDQAEFDAWLGQQKAEVAPAVAQKTDANKASQ